MSNARHRRLVRPALGVAVAATLVFGVSGPAAAASVTGMVPATSAATQEQQPIKASVVIRDGAGEVKVGQELTFTVRVEIVYGGRISDLDLRLTSVSDTDESGFRVLTADGDEVARYDDVVGLFGHVFEPGHIFEWDNSFVVTEGDVDDGKVEFDAEIDVTYTPLGQGDPELEEALEEAQAALAEAQERWQEYVTAQEASDAAKAAAAEAEQQRDQAERAVEDQRERLDQARQRVEDGLSYDSAKAGLAALDVLVARLRAESPPAAAVTALNLMVEYIDAALDKVEVVENEQRFADAAYKAFDAVVANPSSTDEEIIEAAIKVIEANEAVLEESKTALKNFERVQNIVVRSLEPMFPADTASEEERDIVEQMVVEATAALQGAQASMDVTELINELAEAQGDHAAKNRQFVEKDRARLNSRTAIEVKADEVDDLTAVRDDAQDVVTGLNGELEDALEALLEATKLVDQNPGVIQYEQARDAAQREVDRVEADLDAAEDALAEAQKNLDEAQQELDDLVAARDAAEQAVAEAQAAYDKAAADLEKGGSTVSGVSRVPVSLKVTGDDPTDDPTEDPTDEPTDDPTDDPVPGAPGVTGWKSGDLVWGQDGSDVLEFTLSGPALLMRATKADLSDAVVVQELEEGDHSIGVSEPPVGESFYYFLATEDGEPFTGVIGIHHVPEHDPDPTDDPTDDPAGDDNNDGDDDGDDDLHGAPGGNPADPTYRVTTNDDDDGGGDLHGAPAGDDDDGVWTSGQSEVVSNERLSQSGAPLAMIAGVGLLGVLGGAGYLLLRRRSA